MIARTLAVETPSRSEYNPTRRDLLATGLLAGVAMGLSGRSSATPTSSAASDGDALRHRARLGHVTVDGQARLFYRDSGDGLGHPIVFLPAWSMASQSFVQQFSAFAGRHRMIAIDPRGQGLSSPTLEGNDYRTHGRDLAAVVDSLRLDRFILVGWSNGCLAAAAYAEQFGTDRIVAFVDIDQPALPVPTIPDDWAESTLDDWRALVRRLIDDPVALQESLVPFFISRAVSAVERDWLLDQSLRQPPYVGRLLLQSAMFYDFSETLAAMSAKLPVLVTARLEWSGLAESWTRARCPKAAYHAFKGGHMYLYEDSIAFNAALTRFIDERIKS